ncbi:hypothetical protein B0H63DRAFT_474304 [Podospora didyma]|uniref:Microbial-type PARG catalytic domain-containing protein n=1 Tax=Podospora didyma TaxID=330526 RepID=A0AAE0NRG2_9PEZI|nr:hypothetical protein B0H63DRAFT_474304 [Podospora didyma]
MGTDREPDAKHRASRHTRAKHAHTVINKTIPAILRSNARARRGVDAVELIADPPPAPTTSEQIPPNKEATVTAIPGTSPEYSTTTTSADNVVTSLQEKDDETVSPSLPKPQPEPPSSDSPKKVASGQPSISIVIGDTLQVAAQLHAAHNTSTTTMPAHHHHHHHHSQPRPRGRIAILNMASPLRPGGGVLSGATSQEESLCRRTTLYPSLREEFYRLPEVGGIYTPDVLVFQLNDDDDDDSLEGKIDKKADWFFVDVLTAAMLRFPDVDVTEEEKSLEGGEKKRFTRRRYAAEADREMVVRKMTAAMRIFKTKGIGRVVLGAWGCGAYGNPVEEVASAWRKVLLGAEVDKRRGKEKKRRIENDWGGIEEVAFAIRDVKMADAFGRAFGPGIQVTSTVAVEGE